MVSPYLERRLRSYQEAVREIRKRHAGKRTRTVATRPKSSRKSGPHLRIVKPTSKTTDQTKSGA